MLDGEGGEGQDVIGCVQEYRAASQNPALVSLSTTSPSWAQVASRSLVRRWNGPRWRSGPAQLGDARSEVGHEVGSTTLPRGVGRTVAMAALIRVGIGDDQLNPGEPAGDQAP